MVQPRGAGSDTGEKPRYGNKNPALKNATRRAVENSPTKTHSALEIMSEKAANVQEQSTGRKRVRQEMGSTVDNSR